MFGRFQIRLQTPSLTMQYEGEHENGMVNAVYWIAQYCLLDQNLYLEKLEIKLDVQNKWLVIAIVLVIIDIILFILFYWIFKHIFLELINVCGFVFFALMTKVFRVKLFVSNQYDRVEKAELCNNDQLKNPDKVL